MGQTVSTTAPAVPPPSFAEPIRFGHETAEALIKSGHILQAGLRHMANTMNAATLAHFDRTVSCWHAMRDRKSIKEILNLQIDHARTSFEKALSETSDMAAASMKLAQDSMAPIAARMTTPAEKPANGSL